VKRSGPALRPGRRLGAPKQAREGGPGAPKPRLRVVRSDPRAAVATMEPAYASTPAPPHHDHYRSIVQSTSDWVAVKDLEGRYVEANPAFLAAIGLTAAQLLGRRDAQIFGDTIAIEHTAFEHLVFLTRQTIESESSVAIGGSPRHLLVRRCPWRDASGEVAGIVIVATDITERRDAELHREQLVRDLHAANDHAHHLLADQVRLGQRAGGLLEASRRLTGELAVERVYAVGLEVVERYLEGAGVAAAFDQASGTFRIVARGEHGAVFDAAPQTFDLGEASFAPDVMKTAVFGPARPQPEAFSFDAAAVQLGIDAWWGAPIVVNGRLAGALIVGWPAMPDERAEDRWFLEQLALQLGLALHNAALYAELSASIASLRDAQTQIVRTQRLRALGEMASGVAHDFNNSLTTILGLAEWLLHTLPAQSPVRGDLATIRTAAMDAAAFVRRLQHFSRVTPAEEEREAVDLAEIARVLPELARPRWAERSQRRGIRFDVRVEANQVPAASAIASEIRELLLNLIFNAVDAMPDGGRLAIRTSSRDGFPQIAVVDEGVGMTDDVRARIFEPFFTTKGKDGSGLGLSVCWSIAERHGGSLTVESAPGKGSTFTLTLPPAPAGTAASEPDVRPPVAVGHLRMLLVDDQPDVRESVGEMLGALGHTVTIAADGDTALEILHARRFDLIVTDLGMPGMNGIELARRVHELLPEVPIVLLTGWGADYETTPPPDVQLVLAKPVTMGSLRAAIAAAATKP